MQWRFRPNLLIVSDLSAPRTMTRKLAETEKHEPCELELAPTMMQRAPSPGTLQIASKLVIRFGPHADDMTVELLPR